MKGIIQTKHIVTPHVKRGRLMQISIHRNSRDSYYPYQGQPRHGTGDHLPASHHEGLGSILGPTWDVVKRNGTGTGFPASLNNTITEVKVHQTNLNNKMSNYVIYIRAGMHPEFLTGG
jgi:hypothetical protein